MGSTKNMVDTVGEFEMETVVKSRRNDKIVTEEEKIKRELKKKKQMQKKVIDALQKVKSKTGGNDEIDNLLSMVGEDIALLMKDYQKEAISKLNTKKRKRRSDDGKPKSKRRKSSRENILPVLMTQSPPREENEFEFEMPELEKESIEEISDDSISEEKKKPVLQLDMRPKERKSEIPKTDLYYQKNKQKIITERNIQQKKKDISRQRKEKLEEAKRNRAEREEKKKLAAKQRRENQKKKAEIRVRKKRRREVISATKDVERMRKDHNPVTGSSDSEEVDRPLKKRKTDWRKDSLIYSMPSSQSSQKSDEDKIVITFSGFVPKGYGEYDTKLLKKLSRGAKKVLGIKISNPGNKFDPEITHVVSVTGKRTIKTLTAALTSRWVVSPEWLVDSIEQKVIINPKGYGFRNKNFTEFEGMKVFISDSFRKDNKSKKFADSNFTTLIEVLGRGELVNTAFTADIVLVGKSHKFSGKRCLTWSQFFNIIQPID
eukprot:TRINITY_DN2372_c0_g1_i1.p1 TRINITY_DN2372_c0_g1~~TRINITY_DN2372_c0_g1_i1.p1  ORF type:complete len:488 (+),score=140.09 TRINITY_DN2372_c0_g1_i1:2-1465(+)